MEYLASIWQQILGMQWYDYLDILIVAALIYILLPLIRSSGATRIAGVIVTVLVVVGLTQLLHLHTLSFILNQLLSVGLIALVVLFQPELRRMIDHLLSGAKLKQLLGIKKTEQEMVSVITQTVRACEALSEEKTGALIAFARDSRLEEYFKTGTMIDAKVTAPLLRNVFFPKAALHDGAVIICDGRLMAAGCVLPLSSSSRISVDLGTRHRAALGLSEVTDALVVVVSEETGAISVAVGGILKRHLAPQMLERLLTSELCPETGEKPVPKTAEFRAQIEKLLQKKKGEDTDEK